MSWLRFVIVMGGLSLAAASVLALYSTTPASVREAVPSDRATDPGLGATFTEDQIERHAAFRAPSYVAFALGSVLPLVALVLLARGPFRELVARVTGLPGGWPVHAIVVALALAGILALVTLPIGFVRGYAMQHAWGLSTQDLTGWLIDQAKGLAVGGVIIAVAVLAFYGVVRAAPHSWWVWGWAAFTLLTASLAFLYPVAIAPLFNRFAPLEDEALVQRIKDHGNELGVSIDEVLVADASRRTTAENAYVAGLGATKQVVIYDNLLESGTDDETLFVVAHEMGHRAENHVLKGVVLSSAGLLAGFGVLYLLAQRSSIWSWAGASGVADLKGLPLLLLFLSLATLVLMPLENTVSRRFEAHADRIAIELTGDPDTAVATFRRLAFKNIADLDPPRPLVWALFTHPSIPDRLRSFVSVSG